MQEQQNPSSIQKPSGSMKMVARINGVRSFVLNENIRSPSLESQFRRHRKRFYCKEVNSSEEVEPAVASTMLMAFSDC